MKQPLELRFIGMEPSGAVEAAARARARRLDRFRPDIMACRVTIELAARHQHQGKPYAVRVDVTVPGHELTVDRVQDEDVHVALREAFDDMKRRLQDSARRVQGEVKAHPVPLHGEVVRFADEGRFGFIRTAQGDEYRFDAGNVAGVAYDRLAVGTPVQFIPETAAEGLQAKRVSVGKHAMP
jgi:ribosome-associated translation inhibitor RaiA/cold shock CspA family protein